MKTIGYAAQSADAPLARFPFERRALRPNDVAMEVLYCGVCHTDLHQARNDWGWSTYPLVPGHEIVGQVIGVGDQVTRYKIGDAVAVGCMVDSCRTCDQCRQGEEQLCREGNTQTYNGHDGITGETTYGGYSKHLVVREEFALRVPDGLDLSRAAPLLRAGITTYSLLRTGGVGPGSRVGVIGLGGLGHMAVKLAAGRGLVQCEGEPARAIRPGDVVQRPAGEKHWRGAMPGTAMTHIAIQEALNGNVVTWMEKVTDEEYRPALDSLE